MKQEAVEPNLDAQTIQSQETDRDGEGKTEIGPVQILDADVKKARIEKEMQYLRAEQKKVADEIMAINEHLLLLQQYPDDEPGQVNELVARVKFQDDFALLRERLGKLQTRQGEISDELNALMR